MTNLPLRPVLSESRLDTSGKKPNQGYGSQLLPKQLYLRSKLWRAFLVKRSATGYGFLKTDRQTCVSQNPCSAFFYKLQAGFHMFCTKERLPSNHSAIKARSVEGCRLSWPFFFYLLTASLELRVMMGFLVASSLHLLLWLHSLARRPALEKVLVVPNCLHLRIMEVTVLLGTISAAIFLQPSLDLCLKIILSDLCRQLIWPYGFYSDTSMHCQRWDLLQIGVCIFKLCPIYIIYHMWTPINV